MADEGSDVERFHATNGRAVGGLGLAVALLVLVLALLTDHSASVVPVVVGCLLAGLVIWVVLLRPAVWVDGPHLVLRGSLETRWIPLAAIDRSAVGAMLVVLVGQKRYLNTAISRSRRESRRDGGVEDLAQRSYGAFVESRIKEVVADARASGAPAGDVRREWARPEIAGLAVLTVAFVGTLLL